MLALFLLAFLLFQSLAHATVFWDDHMDSCATSGFCYQPHVDNGIYTFDTVTKFAGAGSIRANFPAQCNITGSLAGQCGGSMGRSHPDTANAWSRFYFRMSGPGGAFRSSVLSSTKMVKRQSIQNSNATEFTMRGWINIGTNGAKRLFSAQENVPSWGRSQNVFTNITLQDNRWYCIETQEVANTPGVANGAARIWVDGVQVLNDSNVMWQRAGSNFLWREYAVMRQNGEGSFWWDEFAAGDTRIGCLGAVLDTAPAAPERLVIQ
jgi:hypothetical protein